MRKPSNPQKADIGKAIVFLADRQGMSQTQLACKAGISEKTISDWSRGMTSPSPRARKAVLQALDCSWQDVEEVMTFFLIWRVDLRQPRAAKRRDGDARVKRPSRPARFPGSSGSTSSFGLFGSGTSSADDDRLRDIGHALMKLRDLMAPPPDRKGNRRR
jgi:transcriptional regulator with XRE-family HTH domain